MAQKGWITKQDRKKRGPVWVFHWYITKPETGRKAEQTCVVGAVAAFPKEKDAWQEIARRSLRPPADGSQHVPSGRLTFSDLAALYQESCMKKLAPITRYVVQHVIDDY